MSDEKVTITVADTQGASTRIVTDESFAEDTCWPHLVEVFLEQLQGLGYKFFTTPEEMVDVLEKFHQDLMCAECSGCEEVVEVAKNAAPVEEKKYPYLGAFSAKPSVVKVLFTEPQTGYVVESDGSYHTGYFTAGWVESNFTKVSK